MFYFMPFTKRLERSGRALPCPVPWGSFCRFTFLSLWLFGVLSQSQQKRGVFMNNQDIPLGWAHVLVGWMRFPSDVINFILLLLLFRHSVVSSSLWPHGLQHISLSCPSPSPRACSNSCRLGQWCHPTISSSVIPVFSCLLSFSASGSFPMSQLFVSGGQSTGVSASASVLPVNIQGWFPLGLISLLSKGL